MAHMTNPPNIQADGPKRNPKIRPKYTPNKHMPEVIIPATEDKKIIETFVTAIPIPTDKASIEVAIASINKVIPLVGSFALHFRSFRESMIIFTPTNMRIKAAIH